MTAGPVCEVDGRPCNRTGGHRRHRRRGEPSCATCLEALRTYQADRRRHPDHVAARAEPAAAARYNAREHARRRRRRQKLVTKSQQSAEVAAELVARDGDWCAWCRSGPLVAAGRTYHVDHDTPLSRGGADHLDNWRLTCPPCNTAKGTLTGAEFLAHRRTTRPVTWPAQRRR